MGKVQYMFCVSKRSLGAKTSLRNFFRLTSSALLATGSVLLGSSALAQSDEQLAAAADNNAEWLSYGRDYSETRYSPVDQINASNVAELGLAWSFDTGEVRGHEATPLVVDGIMYATR